MSRRYRLALGLAVGLVIVAAFELLVYFAWGPWLLAFIPVAIVWADFMGRLSWSWDDDGGES
jgi:hypothetical protein